VKRSSRHARLDGQTTSRQNPKSAQDRAAGELFGKVYRPSCRKLQLQDNRTAVFCLLLIGLRDVRPRTRHRSVMREAESRASVPDDVGQASSRPKLRGGGWALSMATGRLVFSLATLSWPLTVARATMLCILSQEKHSNQRQVLESGKAGRVSR
jgi:hypothetical protein